MKNKGDYIKVWKGSMEAIVTNVDGIEGKLVVTIDGEIVLNQAGPAEALEKQMIQLIKYDPDHWMDSIIEEFKDIV